MLPAVNVKALDLESSAIKISTSLQNASAGRK